MDKFSKDKQDHTEETGMTGIDDSTDSTPDTKDSGADARRGFIRQLGKACGFLAVAGLTARCAGGSGGGGVGGADTFGDDTFGDDAGIDTFGDDTSGDDTFGPDSGDDTFGPDSEDDVYAPVVFEDVLVGEIEDGTAKGYSPKTGEERVSIPSACWQCVARDGIVCHVEDGRLEHIEGNPKLLRSNGKLCSRGQGGVGQVYDPDRLLFPMRRVAGTERGAGQWERISWDDAMAELSQKLQATRESDPKKLFFHYGRMKASSSKLVKDYFLYGYGTKSYAGHTAICESAKWTAQELVWGKHYDVNDVEKSNYILNFGSNPLNAHTNHLALSQRLAKSVAGGTPLYTFDVRLSNTAARSTEWLPIKPGTDLAVVLAILNHILANDLAPQAGKDFINTWTNIDSTGYADKVAKLAAVMADPQQYIADMMDADAELNAYWVTDDQPAAGYTPEWAEAISGVPAAKIVQLAEGYAAASPGSTVISYRGAVMHFNGVNTERAIQTLEGLCGNIDTEGGRVHGVGASWNYAATYPKNSSSGLSKLSLENKSSYLTQSHGSCHQVLDQIAKAAPENRPDIYMVYCYTPAYANGDIQSNIDILKDQSLIPYIICCDVAYTEAAMYADLIIPDATYLERWDWEDMVSNNMIPEWYIRQPAVTPLGEVRDFKDVCIELAAMLSTGPDVNLEKVAAVGSTKNYVEAACNDTTIVNDAGIAKGYANGFEFMKAEGAYWDPEATPKYMAYAAEVTLETTDP
ncbi:MAG: molybdopterin-dependent oxidoreductase, partial [Lentisphaerae bacterium]|nr:molybdopterin-dependent oxidoreductase [Lentisphaerota bacterium]